MGRIRAWVPPLAFTTLGAVLGAAAIAVLQENPPIFGDHQLWITWLTLFLSAGALVSAIAALVIARHQMRDGQIQVKLEELNQKRFRVEKIKNIIKATASAMQFSTFFSARGFYLDDNYVLFDNYKDTVDFKEVYNSAFEILISMKIGDEHDFLPADFNKTQFTETMKLISFLHYGKSKIHDIDQVFKDKNWQELREEEAFEAISDFIASTFEQFQTEMIQITTFANAKKYELAEEIKSDLENLGTKY